MSDLEVKTVVEADRAVVTLDGTCDLRSHDVLAAALRSALDVATVVVVDLARVHFLDSSNLRALVSAHLAARQDAKNVHVINAAGSVAAMLEITGVIALLAPPAERSQVGIPRAAENPDG
ncbi:hypothetical protein Val02_29850 [Virgisporangium aliadipatigenens]|uniref:STAS domain-containing protein n=1 Tax=Virgisporangium aliadipatigenens TaxID=741659 RepID=A0A8J3YIU1_9ACTN|nr:STAS domain-containing protein [Virgisporangium aliadipatigenens]GIJ46099.1 hypothetical protein Val02_29850 [Virgisporangium aliadipatigenens]